ncbi:aldo/keto reductase [Mesorhizobium sp. CAU 1741]|uniref:aldo/keto reductase n=1 Tax=Mesorhizobium sp. CAU 1741 TaxID=3140366 RepID=UPI00325AFEDA
MTILAEKRPLFAGGPDVSPLCLGTMMFADQTGRDEAENILETFFAAGGNFIDTADSYSSGKSEEMLGELLGRHRDACVLATKVGNQLATVPGSGGISAEWIRRAAAMSLDRLKTDCIDLYYLHLDDERTPLEETITALGRLIDEGAIRYWGVSNFRPWKIAEMIRVADLLGVARPAVLQPYYHMLNRTAESDALPACAHFSLGVVPYSPLGRGILTGKYRGGTPPGSRGARGDKRILETEFRPETLARAAEAAAYAEARDLDPVALAVNWVLAHRSVSSVLVGPKTRDQFDRYLDAVSHPYHAEDEAFLSGLCPPGHTPAPGHTDPRYALRGRMLREGLST